MCDQGDKANYSKVTQEGMCFIFKYLIVTTFLLSFQIYSIS